MNEKIPPFTSEELERYHRQMIMPEIGLEGQLRLKNARVFIGGMGGLGSVSAFYLAAAGVGELTIVDGGVVELSNLNRQIAHGSSDLGRKKTQSALEKLSDLNPHCRIQAFCDLLDDATIDRLVGDCQFIVDATDNAEARRVLNRVAVRKGIPFVYGGIDGFCGMVSTFVRPETPCFECLFPNTGQKGGPVGVIGPVPGIVASLQSIEVIKLILGLPGGLKGKLLRIRLDTMDFSFTTLLNNPHCRVCGIPITHRNGS